MAEKMNMLGLERDYKKFLYFVDGEGNVCSKERGGEKEQKVLVPNAVTRDSNYLYYVDKEGDVSRSPRARGRQKVALSA